MDIFLVRLVLVIFFIWFISNVLLTILCCGLNFILRKKSPDNKIYDYTENLNGICACSWMFLFMGQIIPINLLNFKDMIFVFNSFYGFHILGILFVINAIAKFSQYLYLLLVHNALLKKNSEEVSMKLDYIWDEVSYSYYDKKIEDIFDLCIVISNYIRFIGVGDIVSIFENIKGSYKIYKLNI